MDFSFSEEQQELRKLARRVLEDLVTNERLREIENREDRFDPDLWKQLSEINLLGVTIAEDFGGMDFGFLELCLLIEEVGRTVAPVPVIPTLVTAMAIGQFGTSEQKQRLLAGVVSGDLLLTSGLVESGSEDPLEPQTSAAYDGEVWRLNGNKMCVPFAHLSERVLVAARSEDGIGIFLVDPKAPGVELHRQETTAFEPQFTLRLSNARVEAVDVLARPEDGLELLEWLTLRTMAAYCALQVGISEKAMLMTAGYTSQREQFGVKIATFQAVGQRAADCYIDVECLRVVTLQAVSRLTENLDALDEVTMAKIWAGDAGHRVSSASQHLHGGIGLDIDYPLFRYCLWSKQVELTLGSTAYQVDRLGRRIAEGSVAFD